MSSRSDGPRILKTLGVLAIAMVTGCAQGSSVATNPTYSRGAVTNISASCSGQNAEVEQAADAARGYVYEAWIGCSGIAFARSTDRGRTFQAPSSVPGSIGSDIHVWDPAVAVAPDGTVYAAFMIARSGDYYPMVAASFDNGATFSQVSPLLPPDHMNWGDRDFIAVGPDGTVYVTWDYGPERTSVTLTCPKSTSCAFATGDFNAVIQKSTDKGATWSPQSHISPGFPASGADSAPLVIETNGQIDVMYQGYHISDKTTFALDPAYSYFTSSADGGQTWSAPLRLGPVESSMPPGEWWVDGDIARDAGGNLYATWDTRDANRDTGWLSFSTDHGTHWSPPVHAPTDQLKVPHIMEVAGGGPGIAYVAWLSPMGPHGYGLDLRTFSIGRGWVSDPFQVSTEFGDTSIWPGDTFGISTLAPNQVVLSWGSAVPTNKKESEIFAAPIVVRLP
jgi:hypothetical protein